ncbi:uncharacterized protein DUF3348 [Paraburkholderia sp. BL18I3N2]|uniref:DUF3348 domain-containing protein n=1 Tax=Paraburkholderia sp. BL18I3N2 TaxID=1938799 RepID=UPI000D077811|nr:DUF3348 domain-containing protein [Paraburkholderia sp. BL18I3N2]PRX36644.1 uncharacterized protein DUF3348 [Paraburkholderia sp. BL18I3N2]
MLQAPQRTALSGPALIRLLARLADVDVPESRQSLSDRLSQWLGWTDAIALSSVLNGNPPAVSAGTRGFGSAEESEYVRARSSLAKTITGDSVFAADRRRGPARASAHASLQSAPAEPAADYAVFRQRYLSIQQSMEMAIGNLRGRLRGMLATRTPAMARLAVVDAVMERALSERERNLLAAIPALLAGHFERLRAAELAALAAAEASDEATGDTDSNIASNAAALAPGAWLNVFRKDMQSVLLAELDIRLQPVEGLLAALRAS